MRLSPFFAELRSAYDAELEDLATDSAGHDVLASRLRAKQGQLAQLLPMITSNPEMVAAAFHGGIRVVEPGRLAELATRDADELPPWCEVEHALVELAPWAADLARPVVDYPGGERFLVIAACLEYLQNRPEEEVDQAARWLGDRSDDEQAPDFEEDRDLAEAGADWLAEQGFDQRDRLAGE